MRLISSALTLALLTVAVAAQQPDQGWRLVASNQTARLHINAERITRQPDAMLWAWERLIYRSDTPEGRAQIAERVTGLARLNVNAEAARRFHHVQSLFEYDCAGNRRRLLAMSLRDAAGNSLHRFASDAIPDQWAAPEPGGLAEAAMRYVCEQRRS